MPNDSFTFAFMNDVHLKDGSSSEYQASKNILAFLPQISRWKWPRAANAPTENIRVEAIFVSGDLTNYGGNGATSVQVKTLFKPWESPDSTPLPAFIGLGNHDVDNDYGFPFMEDRYRDQMWNRIAEFHSSFDAWYVSGQTAAKADSKAFQAVTAIDAPGAIYNDQPDWRRYSFNYVVDFPMVSIFQLHKYAGFTHDGRAGGMGWLQSQLQRIGTQKPIMICQHYGWDVFSTDPANPSWSPAQWDPLLQALRGYTVAGLFHGHIHYPAPYQYNDPNVPFNIFSPGNAFDGNFGICRVGQNGMLDVLFLNLTDLGNYFEPNMPLPFGGRKLYTRGPLM